MMIQLVVMVYLKDESVVNLMWLEDLNTKSSRKHYVRDHASAVINRSWTANFLNPVGTFRIAQNDDVNQDNKQD